MSRKRFHTMACPIARALDQIGDWWTLLIVREAFYGAETFSTFRDRLGIARNILTGRLAILVDNGILEKVQPKADVGRYAYRLSAKGRDLVPVLVTLLQWGDTWASGAEAGSLVVSDRVSGAAIKRLVPETPDGRPVDPADLRFAYRRGDDASA